VFLRKADQSTMDDQARRMAMAATVVPRGDVGVDVCGGCGGDLEDDKGEGFL